MDASSLATGERPGTRARHAGRIVQADAGPATLGASAQRLARYLWPYRWSIALAIGCFFSGAAMEPLAPALLKYLLDNGFQPTAHFPVWIVPVVVVALFTVRGAANFGG